MREDLLAKRMFYGGCLFLPWLWAVNVLYFRRKVYGDIPLVDTAWGGGSSSSSSEEGRREEEGIEELMPRIGGVIEMGGSNDDNGEGNGQGEVRRRNNGEEFDDEHDDDAAPTLSPAEIQMELTKWVKRSTVGAFFGFSLFTSWIIVFQLNKDSFGSGWFVMDQDEEDLTGW